MTVLICGSFAFDNIMVFNDRFKNHILPDQVHILNVCFLVPKMRQEFGGCAGNIAFNLKLLGGNPLPMGTVGEDFDVYAEWMDRHAIDRRLVTVVENTLTARAFVTTDMDDNQITAFHPGAMEFAHRNQVDQAGKVKIGIVSPDGREGMLQHAEQFAAAGIPFIFDPGQGLPMFDADELKRFISQATWLAVNDYEWQLIQNRTGLSVEQAAAELEALIVTRGGEGSHIYTAGRRFDIPAAQATQLKDPTGCGDAYRAGLLFGLSKGYDWETTGRIASLMGAIKIEHHGTQNQQFDPPTFAERFQREFGFALEV